MSYFAKIWTDIFTDKWFMSLSAIEGGTWLRLIVIAKMQGDTGEIEFDNISKMKHFCTCSFISAQKMLQKFQDDGKVLILPSNDGKLHIKIVKYDYWQRVKGHYNGQKWNHKGKRIRSKMKSENFKNEMTEENYSLTENNSRETTEKIAGGNFSDGQKKKREIEEDGLFIRAGKVYIDGKYMGTTTEYFSQDQPSTERSGDRWQNNATTDAKTKDN